ncbi:glycoside hydrolase family 2 protein [Bacteroides clarus]|uniref:glycoside hydrolase family 2 protein n=1 Tax=Bacteroides clarus TaxID=626929 RepID=UPI00266BA6A9|nr:glycoside hydrolase family 2 TIM barrel-domain containing protein [Bacteroides clarus]
MANSIHKFLLLICGLFLHITLFGENAPRISILLDKGWGYKPITDNKKDAPLIPVTIPHTWNARYQVGTTKYNRELMVYKRNVIIGEEMKNKRLFLYFEGVNSVADVFVNNQTVGQHLGGYTAFCFEITDYVRIGDNVLEVWANNAYRTDVLPISGDFNVYGGIHRPCSLIVTEKNCISPVFYASPGVFIHQKSITSEKAVFTVETILSLKESKRALRLCTKVCDTTGKVIAKDVVNVTGERVEQPMHILKPILWNGKENPYLYDVIVELYDGGKLVDRVTQKTGFRYFKVDHDKGFYLNGKLLDLHGFCRHEDFAGKGSALTSKEYDIDMKLIKEVGATAMRLVHYPHAETMYNLCDENGIILWTEIPLCGPGGFDFTGYLNNKGLKDNARQAVKELVYQKYNHPSICFWGIFNELLVTDNRRFQAYDSPIFFVKELNKLYKSLDTSRLTTFATCVDETNFLGGADLVAWNKYFNWKIAEKAAGQFFDNVKANSQNYPVGVSEYGAAGSIYQHTCPFENVELARRIHPEEYQAICHEGYWLAFIERPYLWGKFIWQFSDTQSFFRRDGDMDGINDKGNITYDRKTKKDAFYFYKANWSQEPVLYLCSRRFTERTNPGTQVKVYSNLDEAVLYINNKKIGKCKKDKINRMIWNDITLLPGKNVIRVESMKGQQVFSDTCTWNLKL